MNALHVLLITSNELAREAWGTGLRLRGDRVTATASVAEACRVLGAEAVDVIVLDCGRNGDPSHLGRRLAALRRAAGWTPAVALVPARPRAQQGTGDLAPPEAVVLPQTVDYPVLLAVLDVTVEQARASFAERNVGSDATARVTLHHHVQRLQSLADATRQIIRRRDTIRYSSRARYEEARSRLKRAWLAHLAPEASGE